MGKKKKKKPEKEKPAQESKPPEPEEKEEREAKKETPEPEIEEQTAPPLLDEPIPVTDYLYMMIASLDAKAWAYMDFIAHPETQKHTKDLAQAKNAIDAIDALYKIVQDQLTPEQKKDIETRLTNLRLNFVKTS
ncbi:MAG: DUF1844 domain-containing protein [candidate division WOR-3 bacterium]|nr:MAG: DUF1844 domain-containing protein [candidate division WOR-3 bacterium]